MRHNLRICHISSVHQRYDTRIYSKQCVSLARRYSEVSYVVADGKGDTFQQQVYIRDLGNSFRLRLERMLKGFLLVIRSSVVRGADIVHVHDPELLIAAFIIKKRGQTVIYDAHESTGAQIKTKHYMPRCLRSVVAVVINKLETWIAARCNAVVAATPYIATNFIDVNAQTITVCNYPLLESMPESIDIAKKTHQVCYTGAITRERSFVELLDALEICQDVTLLLCGPFESKNFENELRSHSGWKCVDYRGVVDRESVHEIMTTSVAGIVLFHPGPNHVNAQPNKLFEYMSSGLPVIASDFPLWRDIVCGNQCGVLVDPMKAQDIATAIRFIVENPDKARSLGSNGRSAVLERYNWRSEEQKLFALYDSLTSHCRK